MSIKLRIPELTLPLLTVLYECLETLSERTRNAIAENYFNKANYFIIAEDYKKALEYYKLAAENGDANAANILAGAYELSDLELDIDYKKELEYYKLAAENGDANASYKLGWSYEFGMLGLKHSNTNAIRYYQIASRQGHAVAPERLASLRSKTPNEEEYQAPNFG